MAVTTEEKKKPKGPGKGLFGVEFKSLSSLRRMTTSSILGMDEKFLEQNRKDDRDIRTAINRASSRIKDAVGSDICEFFSAVTIQKANDPVNGKLDPDGAKNLVDIQKLVEKAEVKGLNKLLIAESERVALYHDYRRIKDMIPQMSQAVDTYVDNIMSPDDFTKISLTYGYEGEELEESDRDRTQTNLKFLDTKYSLSKRARKILRNSLIDGDYFLAVISLKKELTKLLSEDGVDSAAFEGDSLWDPENARIFKQNRLTEGAFVKVMEGFEKAIDEAFDIDEEEDEKAKKESEKGKTEINGFSEDVIKATIDGLNSNLLVANNSSLFLAEASEDARNLGEKDEEKSTLLHNPFDPKNKKKDKDGKPVEVAGSVLRTLMPERVVKLEVNDVCYGYLYFEPCSEGVDSGEYLIRNTVNAGSTWDALVGRSNTNKVQAAKQNFIHKLFIKGIAKRLNRDVLEKNKQFADVIYNLLQQDYLIRKKVRVTYLTPNECVHFGDDTGEGVYYDSLFQSILFTAKLYISILTATLMHRLVRAPSKRIFYIETGLDNDEGAAVNTFIRDLRSKELTFDDIASSSINHLLALIGSFNDIFVPVVSSEKPVDVETIEENSPQMQDEFMEWLMKALTAGTGIPHAFIADSEAVQFARSLTMENAKFLRSVVRRQQNYGEQFSILIQILYRNEYGDIEAQESTDKEKKKKTKKTEAEKIEKKVDSNDAVVLIDIYKLFVRFPPPASLNVTNLSDQINNMSIVMDFLVSLTVGDNDEAKVRYFRLAMAKELMTTIPWDKVEKILKEVEEKKAKKTLDRKDGEDEEF